MRVEGFFGRIATKFSAFAPIPLHFREDIDLQQNFMLPMQLWNFVHRLEHTEQKDSLREEEEKIPKAMPREMILKALETRAEFYGPLKEVVAMTALSTVGVMTKRSWLLA